MFSYRVYQQTIHTNIALNLPSIPLQAPNYHFIVQEATIDDEQVCWVHDYEGDNGYLWYRIGKLDSAYYIRFTGYADFIYNEVKNLILCFPEPSTEQITIEHLLLDQVLPRILSRKNFIVLHTSAIACEKGALGFVGETGSGKSTISATYGQHGYSILTDDCLLLQQEKDQFYALPSYPAIRLNPDIAAIVNGGNLPLPIVAEYSSKLRLNPTQGGYVNHKKREVLCALFVLTEPDKDKVTNSVCIEQCSMREAFSLIIGNVFRLDPTDKQCSTNEFKRLNALVSATPVYRLKYPRNQSALSDVMQTISDLLKETTDNK